MSDLVRVRKNSGWHRFTEQEQAELRRIYEQEGVVAASAYCSKINKPWSRSSISNFFRKERASQGVTDVRKLRADSRWLEFTEVEQEEIRRIFVADGVEAARAYCQKIGKDWSCRGISECFAPESAALTAKKAEVRKDVAEDVALRAAYAAAGMDITEATAFKAAGKLREIVRMEGADPKTAEGREIILRAVYALGSLRRLVLREQEVALKGKAVGLAERRLRDLSVKAVTKMATDPAIQAIVAGAGASDEKTEALGRAIFGEDWDT